ncbi:DUF6542 domain-containing protein [Nocardioides sp. C4-1]|uniref:DUF6542 domain-containing protein n=1 Tax=Nocardioides sp. C4-1 TaxID=3151851 RepID=UPI0032651779
MSLPGTRTVWEEGHEPGREVASLGIALALTAAAIDILLTGEVGWLFDLGFLALCAALALVVRPRDAFTVGVLPPLLMLATFLLLAMSRADSIAEADDGVVQAVVSGLSHHSAALVVGYLIALGVLAVRHRIREIRAFDDELDPDLSRNDPGPRLPV